MCQALERTLNIYINALPGSDNEYIAISNLVQEPNMPYGQEYISLFWPDKERLPTKKVETG
jgi:hypothetical protein